MIRNYLVRPVKGLRGLIVAAVSAGLLMSGWMADDSVFAEEDTIVTDDSAPEEPAVQEETTAAVVDPSSIDGLFEVAGESSDSKGASGSGQSSDEKKNKKDEKKLIVGYKQVGVQASIHFDMGEKPSLDSLQRQFPSQLDVYFLGEKKAQTVPVTWECYGDDYSNTNLNYYFFTPKFDESKYSVKGMNLQSESPYIEVVQDALTYEMIDSAPPKENEAAVFKYCTEKLGLNTAAACGVLANIYCESGFRTNAIGDSGTSVGICQWHNGRWTNLKNYAPDDWQTLEGQLRFMKKELRTGYSATLNYIRNVSDDEQGAYDAAYYWCMHYEMPDKIVSRSTTRGYLAKNVYWKRYGLGEDETEAESGMDEDETEAETDLSEDETEAEAEDSLSDEKKGSTVGSSDPAVEASAEEAEEGAIVSSADAVMEVSAEDDEEESVLGSGESESEVFAVSEKVKTEDNVVSDEVVTAAGDTDFSSDSKSEDSEGKDGDSKDKGSKDKDSKDKDSKDKDSSLKTAEMDDSYAGTYRCISSDGLNIREEQSTDADVAGFIPPDDKVTVIAGDGEWAKVKYGETEGYSMLEFLEKIEDEAVDEPADEAAVESESETESSKLTDHS